MTAHVQTTLPDGAAWQAPDPEDDNEWIVLYWLRDWRRYSTPIGRADLAKRTGRSDRSVRAAIEGLRRAGWLIVAEPRGGYRLATTREDQDRLLNQLRSRSISLYLTYRRLREAVQRCGA